jgi:hypothetical protein
LASLLSLVVTLAAHTSNISG